ncbi:hypothetical protein [Streptomyces sp. NBC_01013]|uniref:hypothetical protein n=1 Tax=Streptomyces sp. NBC_01013 TaxID=2903718 RepID=UPI00386D5085|nr:hypothetical protein OG538_15080 [Streptomyces sp. NBC_01013]
MAGPDAVRPARRDADWDGGWRRVAPPAVTIARSSIGVSDGLRFRSGLASWQNVSYGGELGHAVLPSAPVGLIHGVARPGVARPTAAGTPLLLRAAAGGQEEPVRPSSSDGPGRAPAPVQRAGGSTQRRGAAGRAPVVRQPGPDDAAARPGPDAEPAAGREPSAARRSAGAGRATAAAPQAGLAAVRPRRVAPSLVVARRPVTALRNLAAVVPAGTPARAPQAGHPTGPGRADAGRTESGKHLPTGAVERPAGSPAAPPVRPALGKPLRELPPDAAPFVAPGRDGGAPSPSAVTPGPALPVVQRQTSETAGSGAPTPATAHPSGASPSRTSPSQGSASRTSSPGSPSRTSPSRASSPASASPERARQQIRQPSKGHSTGQQAAERQGPVSGAGPMPVQPSTAPAPTSSGHRPSVPGPSGPGSQARTRGGLGAPLSSLPPTADTAHDAPLLGDSRRARPGTTRPLPGGPSVGEASTSAPTTASSSAPRGMPLRSPAAAGPGVGPASPSPQPAAVQRTAETTRPSTGTAVTPPSSKAPATAPGPVRIRRIAPRGLHGQPSAPAERATGTGPAPMTVQRSRGLLAGRTLTVSTGAAEGFSAPASAATARPVVAATWRRDVRPQGSEGPTPGDRTPAAAPRAGRDSRPNARPDAGAMRQAHGATVQRSVPGSVAPAGSAPAGSVPAGLPRAGAPSPGARAQTSPPPSARSLARLVQRSVRGATPSVPSPGGNRPSGHEAVGHRTDSPGPASRTPGLPAPAAESAPPVPVVRPHPPGSPRPGGVAVPVQRLPMPVAPESGASATGPAPDPGAPGGVPQPLTVRASRPAPGGPGGAQPGGPGSPASRNPAPRNPASRNPAPGNRASGSRDQALQRAVDEAGLSGVPVRVVQPKAATSASAPTPAAADAAGAPRTSELPGLDIEELARRLLDPVSRLIRADLRRGRERSGRPYDGRR